jgi:hypothetical protein
MFGPVFSTRTISFSCMKALIFCSLFFAAATSEENLLVTVTVF